ncbi:phage tail tip lysozyme [Asaia astilbis]
MAGKSVSVAITAQDRASSTLERINSRLAHMQVPARRTFGALQRFSQVSGLTRLRGGLSSVAREGVSAFRSIGQIAPVLGTITGATSVAGVYRLASAWAKMGTEIRTTSHAIGIAPDRLAKLQNAARLSGGTGEAVSGALQSLSQTQWEMAHGFAPEAQATFQALFKGTGASLKQVEQMKPEELFDRLIKRLRGIKNPAAQAVAAQKLFGGAAAGLLPILQQTEKDYQANIRLSERYGVNNQKGADAAANLQRSFTGLALAGEGLGFSIAQAIEPRVRTVIDAMSGWIAENREWIALRIGRIFDQVADAVGRVVKWLQDGGWDEITGKIGKIVDTLGGWRQAAIDVGIVVGALYAAPALAGLAAFAASVLSIYRAFQKVTAAAEAANAAANPVASAGKKSGILRKVARGAGYLGLAGVLAEGAQQGADALGWQHASQKISANIDHRLGTDLPYAYQAYKYYTEHGRSSAEASGLVARLSRESGFNVNAEGDGGKAYGIAQWHPARQADFERQFGHNIRNSTFEEQLQFSDWELNHTEKKAGDRLRESRTAAEAGAAASLYYARPQDTLGEASATARDATLWQRRLEERDRYGSNSFAAWGHDTLARIRGSFSAPDQQAAEAPAPQASPGNADWGQNQISGLRAPAAAQSSVKIEIDHKNAPDGTKMKATSSSPDVQISKVRTSRAMDPTATSTGY